MQHTDKTDAEFETWWNRQPHREQFEDVKDQMRNVWRASRRELVIELPEARQEEGLLDKTDLWEAVAANQMLEECRAAVTASGAKVKS